MEDLTVEELEWLMFTLEELNITKSDSNYFIHSSTLSKLRAIYFEK